MMTVAEDTKRCSRCEIQKPLAAFSRLAKASCGLQSHCRDCQRLINQRAYAANAEKNRQRAKAYKEANKERTIAVAKDYREANPDRVAATKAAYRLNNAAKVKAARKIAYDKNKERENEIAREYKRIHKDRLAKEASEKLKVSPYLNRFARSQRRAAERRAIPKWANRAVMRGFYETADGLGMLTGEWHHVDHIVPLQSKIVCGLHCEANLQILLASENQSKGNRVWPDMPSI